MTVWTLMRLTLLELWRQRIALAPVVVFVLIVLFGFFPLAEVVVDGEVVGLDAKTVATGTFRLLQFFGGFLGLVVGAGLIANEVDRGTVLLLATKPLPRWGLVLGKALGATAFLLIAFVAWGLALAAIMAVRFTPAVAAPTFAGVVLGVLPAILFMAVTLAFSTRLPALGAIAAGLFTWMIAGAASGLAFLKDAPSFAWVGRVAEAVSWVLPAQRLEGLAGALTFGPPPQAQAAFALLAIIGWLAIAVVGFVRRDLS